MSLQEAYPEYRYGIVLWLITQCTIVPNTTDRSSAVQKGHLITNRGGGCVPFSKNIYSLLITISAVPERDQLWLSANFANSQNCV